MIIHTTAVLPDSANIAGTAFACALVKDNRKLHFITSLELQTILYLLDMEKQLLALSNFVCDEAKLGKEGRLLLASVLS